MSDMSRYKYEKISRGIYGVRLRECGTKLGQISALYYQSDNAMGWEAKTVRGENLGLWNANTREEASRALDIAVMGDGEATDFRG